MSKCDGLRCDEEFVKVLEFATYADLGTEERYATRASAAGRVFDATWDAVTRPGQNLCPKCRAEYEKE